MTGCAATILIPTTGDRGPVLGHSVASVLAQTVDDLELFIVGDGVTPETRAIAGELVRADPRVRFVDRPAHERRGEPYRHELLGGPATGAIVAYLCDRDLWLPTHLEELGRCLADADFAHTLRFRVDEADRYRFTHLSDLAGPDRIEREGYPGLVPLSFAGHTLAAYRRLPHGWRTTPEGRQTDRYMWDQFLDEPWVRVATSAVPTVLSFKRGDHPGLSTAGRCEILERWSPRLEAPGGADAVQREVLLALWRTWRELEVSARPRRGRWRRVVPRSLRRRRGGR